MEKIQWIRSQSGTNGATIHGFDSQEIRNDARNELHAPALTCLSAGELSLSFQNCSKQFRGICIKRFRIFAKLEDVQLTLSGFDLADEGMGTIETPGQLALRNAGALAGCLECGNQRLMTCAP